MPDTKVHYGRLTEGQKTMGLELAGVGLTLVDYQADTVTPDVLTADMFGLEPNVPITRDAFHARIHPDDRPAVLAEVDRLIDPAFDDQIDITHRTYDANDRVRWVHARKRLYRTEGGAEPGDATTGVAAILDITARKSAEIEAEFLIRELQHRTNNVVTVIGSIARLLMRSGPPETFLPRFETRIQNLAQNLVSLGRDASSDLHSTIDAALTPFAVALREQVSLDGPNVALSNHQSQVFAMLTHELATNSLKHGALTRLSGHVRISWTLSDQDGFLLRWQESGGPLVTAPTSNGFGTQVLERFAVLSLSGEAQQNFDPSGYSYQLRAPRDQFQ